jgi:hypothetical protein
MSPRLAAGAGCSRRSIALLMIAGLADSQKMTKAFAEKFLADAVSC